MAEVGEGCRHNADRCRGAVLLRRGFSLEVGGSDKDRWPEDAWDPEGKIREQCRQRCAERLTSTRVEQVDASLLRRTSIREAAIRSWEVGTR